MSGLWHIQRSIAHSIFQIKFTRCLPAKVPDTYKKGFPDELRRAQNSLEKTCAKLFLKKEILCNIEIYQMQL